MGKKEEKDFHYRRGERTVACYCAGWREEGSFLTPMCVMEAIIGRRKKGRKGERRKRSSECYGHTLVRWTTVLSEQSYTSVEHLLVDMCHHGDTNGEEEEEGDVESSSQELTGARTWPCSCSVSPAILGVDQLLPA